MYGPEDVVRHCYDTLGEWLQGWTHPSEEEGVDFQCRIVQESEDIYRYEPHPLWNPEEGAKRFRIFIEVEELED